MSYRIGFSAYGNRYVVQLYAISSGWQFSVRQANEKSIMVCRDADLEPLPDGVIVHLLSYPNVCGVGDDVDEALRDLMEYCVAELDHLGDMYNVNPEEQRREEFLLKMLRT